MNTNYAQIRETTAGELILYVYENGECIYARSGYEYEQGNLEKDIHKLFTYGNTDSWNGSTQELIDKANEDIKIGKLQTYLNVNGWPADENFELPWPEMGELIANIYIDDKRCAFFVGQMSENAKRELIKGE